MRVLMIEPGPSFSVADVHRGWVKAFTELGLEVVNFNLSDRLDFYGGAYVKDDDDAYVKAFDNAGACHLAAKGIEAAAFEVWPDLVFVTSGFYIPPAVYQLLRVRGMKVVLHHLESPYEDARQMSRATFVDANVINDPTNLEAFRGINPSTWYLPHAYDPEVHHPGPARPDLACDFAFVGTGFRQRVEFFEAVDWNGIDASFAGQWQETGEDSILRKFLLHDVRHCFDNSQTAELYRSAKVSANLYRKEAERPDLVAGWSMSPRELELAACGIPFLREARGEGDEVLSMLPLIEGPEQFEETLRWLLVHDKEREDLAARALAAVAPRTFVANARALLRLLAA